MTTLLLTCPTTLMKVAHWLDGGEDTPDHEYETRLSAKPALGCISSIEGPAGC
jgi:hypothetical protein